jgi:hypothetical protein
MTSSTCLRAIQSWGVTARHEGCVLGEACMMGRSRLMGFGCAGGFGVEVGARAGGIRVQKQGPNGLAGQVCTCHLLLSI